MTTEIVSTKPLMNRKWRVIAFVIVASMFSIVICAAGLILVVGNAVSFHESDFKSIRDSLPMTATHVKEKAYDYFPDFVYILRADVPYQDFLKYVSDRQMNTLVEKNGVWGQDEAPDWWTPDPRPDKAYARAWGERYEMKVQYSSGSMFLVYESE